MRFSVPFVFAAISLSVVAFPCENSDEPLPVPLSKQSIALRSDGTANIDFLHRHSVRVNSRIRRGLDNYERNTGTRHPSARVGTLIQRGTGADPLTDDLGGTLWHGTISVGTPGVKYTVDYDTGSSDLFLPGPKCTTNCDGHAIYNPSSSSTSKDLGKTFSLSYGDGSSVSGEQYTDTVKIAGLSATKQTLGAADQYSTGFSKDQFPPDGLLGMAFKSLSVYNTNPVFQTFVAQKRTTEPVFAFKLASEGSELFLGGVNKKLYTGSFYNTSVTVQGYWEVHMDSVSVGGKKALGQLSAIIDTGTTLVVGDPSNVKKLFSMIPGSKDASSTVGAGYWTVPCNSIPTVSLSFGGKSWDISPDTLNLGQVSATSTDCVAGISGQDIGADFWIIGDVFLQNVYTAFNIGTGSVGFAKLA